jgi:hypothetical protein
MDVAIDQSRHQRAVGRVDQRRPVRGLHAGRSDLEDRVAPDQNIGGSSLALPQVDETAVADNSERHGCSKSLRQL